jgi:hypothetical protein
VVPARQEHAGEFVFNPRMHEPGTQTLIGAQMDESDFEQGHAALAMLARHPATARHIAGPNVGNHSVKAPLNIGIANAGANSPPALDISGLPVFTVQCNRGPLAGQTFVVTDPGRALISGKCADIGKVKGPILRGLASRAPYFHNGSAATLMDAVNFYDQRFGIGFTERQKEDLVNFLNGL